MCFLYSFAEIFALGFKSFLVGDGLLILDVVLDDCIKILREKISDIHMLIIDLILDFADGLVWAIFSKMHVFFHSGNQFVDFIAHYILMIFKYQYLHLVHYFTLYYSIKWRVLHRRRNRQHQLSNFIQRRKISWRIVCLKSLITKFSQLKKGQKYLQMNPNKKNLLLPLQKYIKKKRASLILFLQSKSV